MKVAASAPPFTPPPIPWLKPMRLEASPDLGPGLDRERCGQALADLCADPEVLAVVAFGSRGRGEARPDSDLDLAVILRQPHLSPSEKLAHWQRLRQILGSLGVGVDLVVAGRDDAARLSGSRWHVFGDVAREGRVLHASG